MATQQSSPEGAPARGRRPGMAGAMSVQIVATDEGLHSVISIAGVDLRQTVCEY